MHFTGRLVEQKRRAQQINVTRYVWGFVCREPPHSFVCDIRQHYSFYIVVGVGRSVQMPSHADYRANSILTIAITVGRIPLPNQPCRCNQRELVVLTCLLARRGSLVVEALISCASVCRTIFIYQADTRALI